MIFTPITEEQGKIGRRRAMAAEYYRENQETLAAKKRLYYFRHRERIMAKSKAAYDKKSPEEKTAYSIAYKKAHAAEIQARAKLYYRANKDKFAEQSKIRRAKNAEKLKAQTNEWKRANPDQVNAHNMRRRAQKIGSGGSHTAKDMADIMKRQKGRCAHEWCRVKLTTKNRHKDHRIPLKLGGSNDRANMQWLCVACNLRKGAKHPVMFAQEYGRLL